MNRIKLLVTGGVLLFAAANASAHFIFVVPEKDPAKAQVFLSEEIEIDTDIKASTVAHAKLFLRDSNGKETPVPLGKELPHSYEVDLIGSGQRVLFGELDLGVKQRGQGKPYLLMYYPKTILGDAFSTKSLVGEKLPVEIVPVGKPGAVKFRLLADGKPVSGGEITVILPDGTQKKTPLDENAETPLFSETGRFGAWGRNFVPTPGEKAGKKFEETRRYGTLVADIVEAK